MKRLAEVSSRDAADDGHKGQILICANGNVLQQNDAEVSE